MSIFNLIPLQYRVAVKIGLLLLLVLAVFLSGWTVKGWKDEVAYQALVNSQLEAEKKRTEAALEAQKQAIRDRDAAQQSVDAIDRQYTEDMTNANKKIADLRYCIAHGTCRVRLPSAGSDLPATSVSPCVSNDPQRCELSRPTADAILSIAEEGDEAIRQLSTCQSILKTVIDQ